MLKKALQRGRRRDKTGGVALYHPPNLGRPRPALAPGYVEDFDEPRTQLGKGRVLARLGRVGEIETFFSIS